MRLRTRRQYQRMVQSTFKYTGRWILVDIRVYQGSTSPSKLGIIVTRRFGDAPQRNRFKRLVREAFRLSYSSFPVVCEILVRPRSQALDAGMQEIQQELMHFVNKAASKSF